MKIECLKLDFCATNCEKNEKKEELRDKKPILEQKEMDSKHFIFLFLFLSSCSC